MCCGKGKVQLPPWRLPPEPLMALYTGTDRDSRQFRQRIRSYNSALQLAISTVQVVRGITYHQGAGAVTGGVQQVRIQGTVHHMLPPLRHAPDQPPRFAQLYILDPDAAARQRFEVFSALEATTLRRLQDMLQQHHAFAHAYTRPELRDLPDVQLVINADNRALDRRVYNAPTAPEVAAFLPDAQLEGDVAPHRRIVLHSRAEPGRMTYISDLNSAYDPLHFVLLHPWGELGWGLDIPHRDVLHGSPVAGVARPAPGVAAERDGDRGVDADGSVASDDEAAAALDAEAAADAVALAAAGTAQEPPASPVGAAAQRGDLAALAGEGQQRQELLDRVIKRAILTPRNDDAADINAAITNLLPGEEQIYHASNALDDSASEEAQNLYNPEFLNSLTPQGMPPSLLRLKVGMPVILLRNLNTALGLANGTRLLITNMRRHTLQADILTGPRVGQPVILCRIPTTTTDPHLPFHFTRRQFPIRPAFAMTINKSQGQTFDRVGVYLPKPCFSHGQLYVALSRVGAADAITIMALPQPRLADGTAQQPDAPEHAPSAASTANVVFHELLLQQG